jgi:hypothetical protein
MPFVRCFPGVNRSGHHGVKVEVVHVCARAAMRSLLPRLKAVSTPLPARGSKKAIGDSRTVVSDPEAPYFGGRVEARSLVPLGEARLGRIGLDEWLRRSGSLQHAQH